MEVVGFRAGQRPSSGVMTVMGSSLGSRLDQMNSIAIRAQLKSLLCFQLMKQTSASNITNPGLHFITAKLERGSNYQSLLWPLGVNPRLTALDPKGE